MHTYSFCDCNIRIFTCITQQLKKLQYIQQLSGQLSTYLVMFITLFYLDTYFCVTKIIINERLLSNTTNRVRNNIYLYSYTFQ